MSIRLIGRAILMAAIVVTACMARSADDGRAACLYTVTVGHVDVSACATESDPLHVAADRRVQASIAALGLEGDDIRFSGCEGTPFHVTPVRSTRTARAYVVAYPTDVGDRYLAPVLHELAHVLQMDRAQGLDALRASLQSKQIELGADYMVGYLFARVLQGIDPVQFEGNLKLVGRYEEDPVKAHGRPEERSSAFHLGLTARNACAALAPGPSMDCFVENEYARIVAY